MLFSKCLFLVVSIQYLFGNVRSDNASTAPCECAQTTHAETGENVELFDNGSNGNKRNIMDCIDDHKVVFFSVSGLLLLFLISFCLNVILIIKIGCNCNNKNHNHTKSSLKQSSILSTTANNDENTNNGNNGGNGGNGGNEAEIALRFIHRMSSVASGNSDAGIIHSNEAVPSHTPRLDTADSTQNAYSMYTSGNTNTNTNRTNSIFSNNNNNSNNSMADDMCSGGIGGVDGIGTVGRTRTLTIQDMIETARRISTTSNVSNAIEEIYSNPNNANGNENGNNDNGDGNADDGIMNLQSSEFKATFAKKQDKNSMDNVGSVGGTARSDYNTTTALGDDYNL